jgi:hypothetical protein
MYNPQTDTLEMETMVGKSENPKIQTVSVVLSGFEGSIGQMEQTATNPFPPIQTELSSITISKETSL